jgi:NAD(P) transhydrogenase subunit beta
MPDLPGNTVWVAASFLLSILLAAVLAGVAQLAGASRCEDESQHKPWRAMVTTAMVAGLLAAGIGMAAEGVIAAVAGAVLGARSVWRRDFRGRPQQVALRGSGVGLAAMLGGFARYLSSTACGEWACIEVYAAVFIGALIFAVSAMAWCMSRGWLIAHGVVHPGTGVVNLTALLLCIWMGYGFVTEHAQPFGLAILLAMSLLATALGAHLMMNAGAVRGRYAFTAGLAQRSMVRCGFVQRRSVVDVLEGFEWPDDHMPALFDDDFAQSWSLHDLQPMAETARVGACRRVRSVGHAAVRGDRGHCRARQRNRGAGHPGARQLAHTESGDESGES